MAPTAPPAVIPPAPEKMTTATTGVAATLVAISLSKKAGLYLAGRIYGFPRIYARVMRATRAAGAAPATHDAVARSVKTTFRFPNTVAARFRRWRETTL